MGEMKMRNIMFVIRTMHGGGAERVVANLLNEFARMQKYNLFLLTGQSDDDDYQICKEIDRICNLSGNLIKDIFMLRKIIRGKKIDVVFGIDLYANWCVCMSNFQTKSKMVISERNAPKHNFISLKSKILIKLTYWNADGYIFQSEEAMLCYSKSIQKKGVVIHNPVKPDLPLKNGEDKKEIVAIGRLNIQKNYPMMIKTFAIVHNSYPDYKLRIFGRGPEEEKIIDLIKQLKLTDSIKLEGFCENVHDHIINSQIFVMSSNCEGMPNALMEAMAMGFPVVCTDCPAGGPAELIENGENGFLVPVDDCNKFAEAIMRLIEDENLRHKFSNNAKKIRQSHNISNIAKQWEKILYER
jgi:glycosyltransferase involved in cell wall biosynthesis